MNRKTLITTTAAVAITALAVGLWTASDASARGRGGHGGYGTMMIEQFDTDGDGSVTREEFDAGHATRFGKADANEDGQVSFEEFQTAAQARRAQRMQQMFARLDTDGDGVVSAAEADARHAGRFEQMDQNDDGVISPDEIGRGGKFGGPCGGGKGPMAPQGR